MSRLGAVKFNYADFKSANKKFKFPYDLNKLTKQDVKNYVDEVNALTTKLEVENNEVTFEIRPAKSCIYFEVYNRMFLENGCIMEKYDIYLFYKDMVRNIKDTDSLADQVFDDFIVKKIRTEKIQEQQEGLVK